MTKTVTRPENTTTVRPMTRRGPDGRPQETEEMEQRAAEAQKADRDTPRPRPISVTSNPD